jgi:hypothetical protein
MGKPDEITTNAMVALIARWNMAFYLSKAEEAIRDEAIKKIEEHKKTITACKEACRSFGYDRDNAENWDEAVRLFSEKANELYNRTRPEGLPVLTNRKPKSEEATLPEEPAPRLETPTPTVKEIALGCLALAADAGLKAADIRVFIEKNYPDLSDIHDKTVGMTLYRLLKDDLVRREGHTWFFVPQVGETKNPAGDTAGLETSQ